MNQTKSILLIGLVFSCFLASGQQPKLVLPIGHPYGINTAEFSPDGRRIVTAGIDGTAKIWDAITGELLTTCYSGLSRGLDNIIMANYSKDGQKLVITSLWGEVQIWDAKKTLVVLNITCDENVNSASFSPDGQKIVVATWKGSVKIFDAIKGKLLSTLSQGKNDINAAFFSNDGTKIISISNQEAVIWDVSSQLKILSIGSENGHYWRYGNFSKDDTKIIIASWDSTAILFDALTGKHFTTLKGNSGMVNMAKFSLDGKKAITTDGTQAYIWDIQSGNVISEIFDNNDEISSVSFSENGDKVLIGLKGGSDIAKVWDLNKKTPVVFLKGHSQSIVKAVISPNSKVLATLHDNSMVKIWNAGNGTLSLNWITAQNLWSGTFTQDGQKFLTTSRVFGAQLWNVSDGRLLAEFRENNDNGAKLDYYGFAIFSSNDKEVITVSGNRIRIWDIESVKIKHELVERDLISVVAVSPDWKRIVSFSNRSVIGIWDSETGKYLSKIEDNNGKGFLSFNLSDDSRMIVTTSHDGISKIWDIQSGILLTTIKDEVKGQKYAVFSPNCDNVAIVTDKELSIWEIQANKTIKRIKDHKLMSREFITYSDEGLRIIGLSERKTLNVWNLQKKINPKKFIPTDKIISYGGLNADLRKNRLMNIENNVEMQIWNLRTGEQICAIVAIDTNDFVTKLPTGYYQTTTNAAKLLHYVTTDLKVITFEQLDVKYNRPDKVLEAIGCPDTALINSYRKAYYKRIKRLGIDTTSFRDGYSVPEADFANRNEIAYEQENEKLVVKIKGLDSSYKLDRFNIWINEVPLFGVKGISLKWENTNNVDTTISITLSQGENKIETSIMNVNGTESYRMPLNVKYSPNVEQKVVTRFVGIGIDSFNNSSKNLHYCVKDIRDLALKLKTKYGDSIILDTLFNQDVTVDNIKALKQKLLTTHVNDKVIVSYSGHGLLSKDYDYYLSTYTVNFKQPEQEGLPYDELENLLDGIPARKKLLMIDACHSGEVDKDEVYAGQNTADSLSFPRGANLEELDGPPQVGLTNSFDLMQSLFVNVGKNTGSVIISAAAGNQSAQEKSNLQNGVFTYSILEAFEKYDTMTIGALKKYVSERVPGLTNGVQKPTFRNETIAVDWTIW